MNTCDMDMVETHDLRIIWECSKCGAKHKDTKKFMKSVTCPSCNSKIEKWNSLFDEESE